MNGFPRDLYATLAATTTQPNFVFSPASVALALAMAREGAAGTTAGQIDSLLPAMERAALSASARALSAPTDPDLALSIVNSMFVQRGYELGRRFVDALRSQHHTTPELVDYAADPERARARINAWVDDVTRHRIAALLPAGSIDAYTRLTLVNAVYMKARWRFPFTPGATADADFTRADGAVRRVPTMRLVAGLAFTVGHGWRCVSLPYLPGSLTMVIVVPDAGVSMERAVEIATTVQPTERVRIALSMPRFEIETAASLAQPLRELGMSDAFALATADFSGITIAEPMCIGEVIHQANITVDEAGTEAAAATASAMTGSGMPVDPPVELRVDRPFAFAVREAHGDAVLFLGRVGEP